MSDHHTETDAAMRRAVLEAGGEAIAERIAP